MVFCLLYNVTRDFYDFQRKKNIPIYYLEHIVISCHNSTPHYTIPHPHLGVFEKTKKNARVSSTPVDTGFLVLMRWAASCNTIVNNNYYYP